MWSNFLREFSFWIPFLASEYYSHLVFAMPRNSDMVLDNLLHQWNSISLSQRIFTCFLSLPSLNVLNLPGIWENIFWLELKLICQSQEQPFIGFLKICCKFTIEDPCQSVISIKMLCKFIEITLKHGCYPVNLLHIYRTLFPKNTCERMLWQSWRQIPVLNQRRI